MSICPDCNCAMYAQYLSVYSDAKCNKCGGVFHKCKSSFLFETIKWVKVDPNTAHGETLPCGCTYININARNYENHFQQCSCMIQ